MLLRREEYPFAVGRIRLRERVGSIGKLLDEGNRGLGNLARERCLRWLGREAETRREKSEEPSREPHGKVSRGSRHGRFSPDVWAEALPN